MMVKLIDLNMKKSFRLFDHFYLKDSSYEKAKESFEFLIKILKKKRFK